MAWLVLAQIKSKDSLDPVWIYLCWSTCFGEKYLDPSAFWWDSCDKGHGTSLDCWQVREVPPADFLLLLLSLMAPREPFHTISTVITTAFGHGSPKLMSLRGRPPDTPEKPAEEPGSTVCHESKAAKLFREHQEFLSLLLFCQFPRMPREHSRLGMWGLMTTRQMECRRPVARCRWELLWIYSYMVFAPASSYIRVWIVVNQCDKI